jgi:hypothetical protein
MPKTRERHSTAEASRHIVVTVGGRRWRGLEFEARLLAAVFGQAVTPERVVQARVLSRTV